METERRLSRYGDWRDVRAACVSGKPPGQQPFFAGAHAYQRMARLRLSINEIRSAWQEYPRFMTELRDLLKQVGGERDAETSARLSKLLAARKSWSAPSGDDDYSALRLYTSDGGYRQIFGAINAAFRSEGIANESATRRAATFLVELLSIDLFHHRAIHADADGFSGTVYRGMSLSQEDVSRFSRAAAGPILERYISIPLAMASASVNAATAMHFAIADVAANPDKHLVLWEITVRNLEPALLAIYRSVSPASIVTSLCAVPIAAISDFSGEEEVLLRGPHFQIVQIDALESGAFPGPVTRIRAMMHNTNRDHLTAVASDVGKDKLQRDLFRTLILADRFAICSRLAASNGRTADADEYRALEAEQRAAIEMYV
jgi:hypothetical protein